MTKARDLANLIAAGNPLSDGAVAPAELTGVTSTAAELNILDGVTATAAELNLMDGVTATTAELNYVDGVTSNVQTQMDTKAPVASPTFTGTATAPTVNASTALQIGGTAITATAAELNKMDGVTVSASDINSVTTKAPTADPTFTGDASFGGDISITAATNAKLTINDNVGEVGSGNLAFQASNSAGSALKPMGFRAEDVRFATGASERFRFGASGQLGIGGATYGTSGQVLTSGGASAAPTWADAGGGAYELITKTTISSNVTEIIFDSVSAPQQQLLLLINGLQVSNTGSIIFHYRNSSGGNLNNTGGSSDTYRNTGYYSVLNSAIGYAGNSTGNGIYIGYSQTWPGQDFNASFRIFNFGTTATGLQGTSNQMGGGSTNFQSQGIDSQAVTSAATAGIRLYITNSREFTTGEVYLYKLV